VFFHSIFGNVDGVRCAVEEHGADVRSFDLSGYTPLHYAARRPNAAIVRYLIDASADIESASRTPLLETPLLMAVEGGDLEVVHELVRAGADLNNRNSGRFSPLHYAAQYHQLLVAVYLLHNHADCEVVDIYGNTPLAWAVYNQDVRITRLLLRAGANPLTVDLKGLTPLHWAAARGNAELTVCITGIVVRSLSLSLSVCVPGSPIVLP
jgi:ankyrin repeat protein